MNFFLNLISTKVLSAIITSISPIVISGVYSCIDELRAEAEATDNPWDDIFVDVLGSFVASVLPKG